jgi:hypothetical protein
MHGPKEMAVNETEQNNCRLHLEHVALDVGQEMKSLWWMKVVDQVGPVGLGLDCSLVKEKKVGGGG